MSEALPAMRSPSANRRLNGVRRACFAVGLGAVRGCDDVRWRDIQCFAFPRSISTTVETVLLSSMRLMRNLSHSVSNSAWREMCPGPRISTGFFFVATLLSPHGTRGQKVRHLPGGLSDLIHGCFCSLGRMRKHISLYFLLQF